MLPNNLIPTSSMLHTSYFSVPKTVKLIIIIEKLRGSVLGDEAKTLNFAQIFSGLTPQVNQKSSG